MELKIHASMRKPQSPQMTSFYPITHLSLRVSIKLRSILSSQSSTSLKISSFPLKNSTTTKTKAKNSKSFCMTSIWSCQPASISHLPKVIETTYQDSNQYYNVLNIVVEETKIFSTKMRAPFYICLEVYSPIEGFSEVVKDSYYNKIHRPITLKVWFI
jgi:hypothetical protein